MWNKYYGQRGIEPIPELWDHCLSDMAMAPMLNVPAASVPDQPYEYRIAAILKIQAEALTRDRQEIQQRHDAAVAKNQAK